MKRCFFLLTPVLLAAACSCNPSEPVNPVPTSLEAPKEVNLHGEAGETSLTFQWTSVQGAASYEWTLSQEGAQVASGVVAQRNVTVQDLTPATQYRFGVCAVSGDLRSAYTYTDAATAQPQEPDPGPGPGPGPGPDPDPQYYEQFAIPEVEEDGKARAFPGAEGGGMWATGGRSGKVLHVTTLADNSSEGSLRWAINQSGPRTVVFDVAGVIELGSVLNIKNGDLTIAGQTAPGDGICLKNYRLAINASNVVIRFIRCRMGDEKKTEDDAINIMTHDNGAYRNIIIDHCSFSWSTDECASFYGMTNFSFQWNVVSESLRNSVHGKGTHGYGGIWGGENATYHHNLLAHHDSRNPRLDHDYLSLLKGPVSLVNNVIYNWGDNGTYGGESANDKNEYRKYNLINNYYKPGPATASGKVRFMDPWTDACSNCTKKTGCSTIVPGHFFLDGNYMDYSSDAAGDMSADNWKGTTADAATIAVIKSVSRFTYPDKATSMSVQSAQKAYTSVLDYCGASLKRDSVDERVVKETRTRTSTYTGSKGSTGGFIDTQSDVGGWPEYSGETRSAFPDWVGDPNAYTLDPQKRYTNLEMYLHYLVRETVSAQNANATYKQL